jgi:hypothetical protein
LADGADADVPPRRGNDIVVEVGPLDSVEAGWLVDLVDDADRRKQESSPQGECVGETVIQIRSLKA